MSLCVFKLYYFIRHAGRIGRRKLFKGFVVPWSASGRGIAICPITLYQTAHLFLCIATSGAARMSAEEAMPPETNLLRF